MSWHDVGSLTGTLVRLQPLSEAHIEGLAAAAAVDRSSYGFTSVPDGADAMARYVVDLLASRSRLDTLPFAQVRAADGVVVGVTRYLTIRHDRPGEPPSAVEVGGTWLGSAAQRTGINREAKRLLLTHAFEVWGVERVDFKTDARNTRSRNAIAGIGASFEGVLRSWQPSHVAGEEGRFRDSAMFSVVAAEWPAVRARLSGG